jgi:outer membrane immunogenic protein
VNLKQIDDKLGENWRGVLGLIAGALMLTLAAVAVGLIGSARADTLTGKGKIAAPIPVAAVAEAAAWTGLNAYGAVGYGWQRSEFDSVFDGEVSINANKFLATGGLGFDLQLSNVVLGILADASWSQLSKGAMDADWQWFVGLRGGVLVTPNTLAYALAGWTQLDGGFRFDSIEATKLSDIAGITYGGGIEHVFAPGWSARLEYRFVQFGDRHAPDGVLDGVVDGSSLDTGAHQVRLGISKKMDFGWK